MPISQQQPNKNVNSELIEFDPHGDMLLQVGDSDEMNPILFKVCSRTLARASPVFERMLFGKFKESKPDKTSPSPEWRVKLPADKVFPLFIFLHICHNQVHRVPRILSIEDLYELILLTNYYDSTHILGPWVDGWMISMEADVGGCQMEPGKVACIAWEFGKKDLFTRIVNHLLMEANGSIGVDDSKLQDFKIPPDIIERIETIRLATIHGVLEVFRIMVEALIVVDERPRWCRHAVWMGPHRCESMILGSMTFCLARAGLWPLPNPAEVQDSMVGLRRKMTTLVIHDIGQASETVDHRDCNPGPYLLEQVDEIIRNMENPVTEDHYRIMGEKAKILRQLSC